MRANQKGWLRLQEAGTLGGGAEISTDITLYAHVSNVKPDLALEETKHALPYPQGFIPITGEWWDFPQYLSFKVVVSHLC